MNDKKNIQENKNTGSNVAAILKQIMSGNIFVGAGIQKHLRYVFFLFFLAVLYIGYSYKVENIAIESKKLDNELKLLRTEYVYLSSELQKKGTQSEIMKQISNRNLKLKEAKIPFKRIKIK
jgi:hypothetical protein